MTSKEEILALLEGLPDAPTYADAFDRLRPLYNREVAPIIAQYGEPPLSHGHWRRDINGPAETEQQKQVKADQAELLRLMGLLPIEASAAETVDDAMYRLVISYSIDKASLQIAERKGIPHEEVKQRIAEWREQWCMSELSQGERQ